MVVFDTERAFVTVAVETTDPRARTVKVISARRLTPSVQADPGAHALIIGSTDSRFEALSRSCFTDHVSRTRLVRASGSAGAVGTGAAGVAVGDRFAGGALDTAPGVAIAAPCSGAL